jgi:hypothetical protein
MTKSLFIIIVAAILMILLSHPYPSQAGWPLYSKPEFRGRVIDAETKEPIEGAVTVVLYNRWAVIGGPGGPNTYIFKAKEMMTDNEGEFYFSSVHSLLLPSLDAGVTFIFYKPGYMAISDRGYDPAGTGVRISLEDYFSADEVGKEGELHVKQGKPASYKGPMGIVELKRAKTREERLRTIPSPPTDYTSKELPILIKLLNEEGINLGLRGGYK